MKFVVSNHRTFQYLYMNRPKHRLIWAEFFFSNRGKQVQKTLEGLYHRILYQLLKQADYLTRFVQPIFENSAEAQGIWSLIYLEAALLAIVKQREEKINICLFIDALDEQAENYAQDHRRLVETMQNLIRYSDDKTVRVMFCVSSRPETFFMDSFARWPGIRIHENTHNDVRFYVNGRLNSYLASRPDLASNPLAVASLQKTFDEVFARAQGVFLWVKLVATDLIEGLMDGDNPGQIQQHLSSIPGNGELHELYHQILLSLKNSYLNDTFVMLQIAYATLEPLPITEFFSAVNYVHQNKNPELESQSFDEMERRSLSRCRGFLEVQTASWQDQECEKHTGKIVQFLHQSLKDYLAQERSFETIQQKLRIDYPVNGHVHLLKFFTSQHLRKYARKPEDLYQLPQFDLRKFGVLYHSRMVEQTLGMVVSGPLDALAKYIDHNELASVYLRIGGWKCPESWNPSFLSLATQAGLLLYVEQELRRLGGPNRLSGRPLLHWAVMPLPSGLCTMPTDPFVNSPEMIRLLRRVGANLEEEFEYQKFEPRTAFGWAFRQFTVRGAISPVNLTTLKTLLSEGANPNVLVDQTMTALQLCIRNSDRLLAKLLLDFHARIEILTDADWTHLERFNKPMSTITAFRDGELRARDMELFAEFYAQDDDQQKPKNLVKQYPSGRLAIRNGEVYVGNWDFVLEYEKSVKRFLRFYGEGEWVESRMPRPLAECGIGTRREILLDWAMPPDTINYWY